MLNSKHVCLATNDVAPESVKTDLLGAYEVKFTVIPEKKSLPNVY